MGIIKMEDKIKIIELYKQGYSFEYIEYYDKNRNTTKLKGLSPLMYRQQSFNQLQY